MLPHNSRPTCAGFRIARSGGLLCTCRRPVFSPPRVVNVWTGTVCRVVHPVAGLKPSSTQSIEAQQRAMESLRLRARSTGREARAEGRGDSACPSSFLLSCTPRRPLYASATFAFVVGAAPHVPGVLVPRLHRPRLSFPNRPAKADSFRKTGGAFHRTFVPRTARITRALRSRPGGLCRALRDPRHVARGCERCSRVTAPFLRDLACAQL